MAKVNPVKVKQDADRLEKAGKFEQAITLYRQLVDDSFLARVTIYRIKFFLTFFGNLLDAIGPLAVLLVGGLLVIRGHTQISTLVVFISGFQKVADPWDQLTAFYRTLSNARMKYKLIIDALAPGS